MLFWLKEHVVFCLSQQMAIIIDEQYMLVLCDVDFDCMLLLNVSFRISTEYGCLRHCLKQSILDGWTLFHFHLCHSLFCQNWQICYSKEIKHKFESAFILWSPLFQFFSNQAKEKSIKMYQNGSRGWVTTTGSKRQFPLLLVKQA